MALENAPGNSVQLPLQDGHWTSEGRDPPSHEKERATQSWSLPENEVGEADTREALNMKGFKKDIPAMADPNADIIHNSYVVFPFNFPHYLTVC